MSEPSASNPIEPEGLPPPSAELILTAAMVRAYLRRLPKGQRMAYLQDVTTELDTLARLGNVHRIRPVKDDPAFKRASEQARVWWSAALGRLISGVD